MRPLPPSRRRKGCCLFLHARSSRQRRPILNRAMRPYRRVPDARRRRRDPYGGRHSLGRRPHDVQRRKAQAIDRRTGAVRPSQHRRATGDSTRALTKRRHGPPNSGYISRGARVAGLLPCVPARLRRGRVGRNVSPSSRPRVARVDFAAAQGGGYEKDCTKTIV
jgi:hypothetical protein